MLSDTQKVQVSDLVQYLIGTCHSLAEGCGWWEEVCDRNDLNGDALCSDCLDMEVYQD